MNAMPSRPPLHRRAASRTAAHPRIRYIDPLALGGAELGPALDRAAALGLHRRAGAAALGARRRRRPLRSRDARPGHPALGGGEAEASIRGFAQPAASTGWRR